MGIIRLKDLGLPQLNGPVILGTPSNYIMGCHLHLNPEFAPDSAYSPQVVSIVENLLLWHGSDINSNLELCFPTQNQWLQLSWCFGLDGIV